MMEFFWKYLVTFSPQLFSQDSSIVGVWLYSKYVSVPWIVFLINLKTHVYSFIQKRNSSQVFFSDFPNNYFAEHWWKAALVFVYLYLCSKEKSIFETVWPLLHKIYSKYIKTAKNRFLDLCCHNLLAWIYSHNFLSILLLILEDVQDF